MGKFWAKLRGWTKLRAAKNAKALSALAVLAVLALLFQNCGKGMNALVVSEDLPSIGQGGGSTTTTTTTLRSFTPETTPVAEPQSLLATGIPTLTYAHLNGNGHATSWDGRFVIYTHGVGTQTLWNVYALRHEKIKVNSGQINFPADAWSPGYILLRPNAATGGTMDEAGTPSALNVFNAITIGPRSGDPASSNPFRGNLNGTANPNGNYLIYRLRLFTQTYNTVLTGTSYSMGFFEGDIYLENPDTNNVTVKKFVLTKDWAPIRQPNGSLVIGIEPSVTADGRFMVYQNAVDRIFVSYMLDDANPTQWAQPLSLTAIHTRKDVVVRGKTLKEWYPLVAEPIRSSTGDAYAAADGIRGAYPWVSWEGGEAFFQAAPVSAGSATRAALSVVGQNTGWQMRHIDSKINEDAMGFFRSRLFVSAIGMTSSIWNPQRFYKNQLDLPALEENPTLMMLHSNGSEYFEVSFKEYLDGNYLIAWNMNEALVKITNANFVGRYDFTKTPDTSGRNIFGTFAGGAKLPSSDLATANSHLQIGAKAQGVIVPVEGSISAGPASASLTSPSFTVEIFAKPMVDFNSGSNKATLIRRGLDLNLAMTGNRRLSMSLKIGAQTFESGEVGKTFGVLEWQHAASTYDHQLGLWKIFQNGRLVFQRSLPKTPFQSNSQVTVGHGGSLAGVAGTQVLFHMDEFKYSNIARSSAEILESAGVPKEQRFQGSWFSDKIAGPLMRFLKHQEEVPLSDQKVELGEILFSDKQFSSNGQVSCQSCHMPEKGFADGLQFSKGVSGNSLSRNTPTIFNRAFGAKQMWDGKFSSTHQQVFGPFDSADEMNMSLETVVTKLNASEFYRNAFQALYNEVPTSDLFQKSIAAFVNTRLALDSKFDAALQGKYTLTESELRGQNLFNNKARCVACHSGMNFSDEGFHNTGILPGSTDLGRFTITGRNRDRKAFKTPTLRKISETAPYMHDGSVQNLDAVIELYNLGAPGDANRSIEIKPLNLTPQEKIDLGNFLKLL